MKRAWPVFLFIVFSLILIVWEVQNVAATVTAVLPADVYTGGTILEGGDTAVDIPPLPNKRTIRSSYSLIYGPHICTSYGDPFSPFNSIWEPGPYTYHYRIVIPDDYPSDVLRVELFDPDSINQAENTHYVAYSANAHALDPDAFPLGTVEMPCSNSTDQRNTCLIETGEGDLVDPDGDPPVLAEQINPYWLVRVDLNRGTGTAPGNGSCGVPTNYDPAYSTNTLFELYYYAQNPDDTIQRMDLAQYTGQTGDGYRDTGDHSTDMHWVSPGGTMRYDQPVYVPADLGSPRDFELNLNTDLPGLGIDPYTNKRTIYLDITSMSGASGNGFELWAGPLYTDISSDVNLRNLQLVDDPLAHDPHGVRIEPMGNWPTHSAYEDPFDIPLIYIDADAAGQSVFVSVFDSDGNIQPPVTFYFDSIPEEGWSFSFGEGDPDPDGVSGRCVPGSCNNQWVDPSYEVMIPTLTDECDPANPDPQICTPFDGGYLMVRSHGGSDTHVWHMSLPRPAVTIEPDHSQISTVPSVDVTHIFTTTWLEMERMNDLAVTESSWPAELDWDATMDALGVTRGTISVTVSVPDMLWVSDTFTLTLDAEPFALGTTQTAAQPDLTIAPVTQTLSGAGGTVVTYTITITNSGDYTDTFNITLSGNQWETMGDATAVPPLSPHESTPVEIYVTVGPDEADTVQVTFTSSNNSAVAKSAVLTTQNKQFLLKTYLPLVLRP